MGGFTAQGMTSGLIKLSDPQRWEASLSTTEIWKHGLDAKLVPLLLVVDCPWLSVKSVLEFHLTVYLRFCFTWRYLEQALIVGSPPRSLNNMSSFLINRMCLFVYSRVLLYDWRLAKGIAVTTVINSFSGAIFLAHTTTTTTDRGVTIFPRWLKNMNELFVKKMFFVCFIFASNWLLVLRIAQIWITSII